MREAQANREKQIAELSQELRTEQLQVLKLREEAAQLHAERVRGGLPQAGGAAPASSSIDLLTHQAEVQSLQQQLKDVNVRLDAALRGQAAAEVRAVFTIRIAALPFSRDRLQSWFEKKPLVTVVASHACKYSYRIRIPRCCMALVLVCLDPGC